MIHCPPFGQSSHINPMRLDSESVGTHNPELKRALGTRIAIAVVVGNVICSGIFLKPSTIAAAGGNFPMILSLWVLSGILCVLGGLSISELAATIYHGLDIPLNEPQNNAGLSIVATNTYCLFVAVSRNSRVRRVMTLPACMPRRGTHRRHLMCSKRPRHLV